MKVNEGEALGEAFAKFATHNFEVNTDEGSLKTFKTTDNADITKTRYTFIKFTHTS